MPLELREVLLLLRQRKGMRQGELAAKAGVTTQTVGRIERGDVEPELSTLKALAGALGVTVAELHQPEQLLDLSPAPAREVSALDVDVSDGYVPDDIPVVREGDATPEPDVTRDVTQVEILGWMSRPFNVRDSQAFGVQVQGDSMIPVYRPGHRVVVSPHTPVGDGDEVYVELVSGEHLIKVARRTDGGWLLESTNPAYPSRYVRKDEVASIHPIVWAERKPGRLRVARGERRGRGETPSP